MCVQNNGLNKPQANIVSQIQPTFGTDLLSFRCVPIQIQGVGVIQFILHVLQHLPHRFKKKHLCCTRQSTIKHQQKIGWRIESPMI